MYLHDYRWPDSRYGSVKGSLGLATAMCSSVLMASQLKNLYDVYALVSFDGLKLLFFVADSLNV